MSVVWNQISTPKGQIIMSKRYFLVREDILPESILKTVQVKEMLASGSVASVSEAVEKLGLARSTYYKYRDGVHAFFDAKSLEIINISLLLKHISGILSGVLNCIASYRGNVLTINQNLPLNGVALVTIALSIDELSISVEELMTHLAGLNGVVRAEIIGRG
ncbi:MAG: ACT domain-containing protein [Syntrophomonadaceae bacterium]|jgi:chorismate mutase